MKRFLLFAVLLCACLVVGKAQNDQQKAPEKKWVRMKPQSTFIPRQIVKEKEPTPYLPTRESDVAWSRIVWRIIDCREKMNYPLYYPTVQSDFRKSLVQALYDGIKTGEIQAYGTEDDEEFKSTLTAEEVMTRFDASDREMRQEKLDGTGDTTLLIKGEIHWDEVQEFIVKEEWYFDRHYSQFFVRIIGICPVRVYNKTLNVADSDEEIQGQSQKRKLFWIYFPEARRILANTTCFAGKNELAQLSFDDIMHKRRFQSYIIAESNTLNDRMINEYTNNGIEAMMESDRIKREIMNFESDLWEY